MTKQYDRSAVYNMPLEEKVQKGIFMAPVLKRRLDAQDVEIKHLKAQNEEIIAIMKNANMSAMRAQQNNIDNVANTTRIYNNALQAVVKQLIDTRKNLTAQINSVNHKAELIKQCQIAAKAKLLASEEIQELQEKAQRIAASTSMSRMAKLEERNKISKQIEQEFNKADVNIDFYFELLQTLRIKTNQGDVIQALLTYN